jgi:hypothetical protein
MNAQRHYYYEPVPSITGARHQQPDNQAVPVGFAFTTDCEHVPRRVVRMNGAPLHTAIAQHMAHGAAACADPVTESLIDQTLAHSRPADLDDAEAVVAATTRTADAVDPQGDLFVFALGIIVGIVGSLIWPLGWALGG